MDIVNMVTVVNLGMLMLFVKIKLQCFPMWKEAPQNFNFFSEYVKCKFTTYWKYKHEKQNYPLENCDKIEEIENKLNKLEMCSLKSETNQENNILKKLEVV